MAVTVSHSANMSKPLPGSDLPMFELRFVFDAEVDGYYAESFITTIAKIENGSVTNESTSFAMDSFEAADDEVSIEDRIEIMQLCFAYYEVHKQEVLEELKSL